MTHALTTARRRRLLAKGPGDAVRVYSFQHPDALSAARVSGHLSGREDLVDPDYAHAYAWMVARMRERVPGFSGYHPVWAYLRRPNMRRLAYDARPRVLVVADVPRRRMLPSCLHRWHHPLDKVHLTHDEAAMAGMEAAGLQVYDGSQAVTPAMEASWEDVFDLDETGWPAAKLAYWGPPNNVQACIDRIRVEEIVRVTPAPGRLGRNGGRDL